jgi:hypothetical protein
VTIWTIVKISEEIALGVIRLEIASNKLLQEIGNGTAIIVLFQSLLQDVMCLSERLKDETNLVRTARYVVLGPVRVDDLQAIRLVVVELERTIGFLHIKSVKEHHSKWSKEITNHIEVARWVESNGHILSVEELPVEIEELD